MNWKSIVLTFLMAFAASTISLAGSQTAGAVSVKNQTQTILPQYPYPEFKADNMPNTNFRAARPGEYPQLFGGDCNLWRRGRTDFRCVDPFPRKRRNPHDR